MRQPNYNKYYNNLKLILKQREEWRDYFKELVEINHLQKRANWRLFFKIPIFYLLRSFLYLPIIVIKIIEKVSNQYYLSKLENEIEVLKDEINTIDNNKWIK
tara:strand:- start:2300 stop:2605 length:306 start_codon:yes stop_codon:yes gene_type:complete